MSTDYDALQFVTTQILPPLCAQNHICKISHQILPMHTIVLVFTFVLEKSNNSKCERVLAVNWKIFENTPALLMNIISFQ